MEIFAIGLTLGFNYALMALGFALIFSVLRLLNMAHGAIYMVGAYVALLLMHTLGLNFVFTFPLTIVVIFFFGVLVERVAFHPLRKEAHFIPLISTLGVMYFLQELALLIFGERQLQFPNVFGDIYLNIFSGHFSFQQLLVILASLLIAVALYFLVYKTNMGRAIRITGNNPAMASLLGVDTEGFFGISALTFGVGSALAAAGSILISIYYGTVYPTMGLMPLFKAFIAAVIGGMGSLLGAAIGGLFLGFSEAFGGRFLPPGYSGVVVFAILILFLILKPTGFMDVKFFMAGGSGLASLERGKIISWASTIFSKPVAKKFIIPAVILSILFLCLPLFISSYWQNIVVMISIYGILALTLNWFLGYGGMIFLGHAGFFAIGAYVTGILSVNFGVPFIFSLILSGIITLLVGVILGILCLRLSGYALAIATMAFAELIRLILLNDWGGITGGPKGIRGIYDPSFTGMIPYYYFGIFLLAVTGFFFYRTRNSIIGKLTMAIRDNEIGALASGIRVNLYKTLVFAISAFITGIAGGFYAYHLGYVSPSTADIMVTVDVLLMVVIGGMGTLSGPILGAAVIVMLPELLRPIGQFHAIIYGVLLIVLIIFRPQGLFVKRESVKITT